jgi:hypothetical protein
VPTGTPLMEPDSPPRQGRYPKLSLAFIACDLTPFVSKIRLGFTVANVFSFVERASR